MMAGSAALLAAAGLAVITATATATPLTWTGQGSSPDWSNTSNWSPEVSPSGATALAFGALAPACNNPAGLACYSPTNDVSGVSVNSISVDSGENYYISGLPVTVGGGGVTAAPSTAGVGATIATPIALAANQTWSINGSLNVGQISDGGAGRSLIVRLVPNTFPQEGLSTLILAGDAEAGPVTLTGNGAVELVSGGRLNADGAPVSLGGTTTLWSLASTTVGPLETIAGNTTVKLAGFASPTSTVPAAATLTVAGAARFGSSNVLQIGLYGPGGSSSLVASRLFAEGQLQLDLFGTSTGACPALNPGQSYTLVSSTQPITGHFVPNGATVPILRECNGPKLERLAVIADTAHTVKATIIATPPLGPILAWCKRVLRPRGKRASLSQIVAHGGYTFLSTPPALGTVEVNWTATSKHKAVIVATVRQVVGVRKTKLRVALTRAGRKLLRHSMLLRITASVAFAYPSAGAHATFTLKH